MISVNNLSYSYDKEIKLQFPDLSCLASESLLILGKSGAGKTTFLHLLAGLLPLQEGEIQIADQLLNNMSAEQRDRFRGGNIGLVLQQSYFISSLSVLDNIVLGAWLGSKEKKIPEAKKLLVALDIIAHQDKFPHELSAGQQQRVAIARALINKPKVVFADEPTAALDDENTAVVSQLLLRVCKEYGSALIVVTHDSRLKNVIKNQIILG